MKGTTVSWKSIALGGSFFATSELLSQTVEGGEACQPAQIENRPLDTLWLGALSLF